jgi:hypothetical protein
MVRGALAAGRRRVTRSWSLFRLSREHPKLAEAIRRPLTPDEETAVERIERLRAELNASDTPLHGISGADTVGSYSRVSSKPAIGCRLLFRLIREQAT